ncbi:unnamed protein product [Rotaria socialis]|uniref:Uncharacterized protein n=1 Tax=Rotaria socialis TaxID=392032 RepID=A0A821AQ27_9BILA|nr:unnamed protein product [Rotaria socialis]CAF4577553.1 unnamed protein product [Rotaria socialis]CAF4588052.1 unnamed protein product [Rotaria socialis]
MDRHIERCWHILQRTATKHDLEITIVHACLGHFMKNVRKNASKDLGQTPIPFGMWLTALLINSNTLNEMIIIWGNTKDDNITHDIGSEEESIFHLQSSLKELFYTIKQLDYDIVRYPINQK